MSADLCVAPNSAPTSGVAQALYFDSGNHRLFGWLHRPPDGKMTNMGVVVCKPFGYEAICTHRSVRTFSEAAAAIGVPALRFDYLGTGDSAEIEPQAEQLDVWSRDIVAAVLELQRRTGVERVCLLGVRLGGLLATMAANQCKVVGGLILIAPVVSGRRYLRQLRTTQLAATIGAESGESASSASGSSQSSSAGSLEVSGFRLSAATIAALARIDLTTSGAPPVSEILVIDDSSLPTARGWKSLALAGVMEMIMTAPQFAVVPADMLAAIRDWLLQIPRASSAPLEAGGQHLDSGTVPPIDELTLSDGGATQQAQLTERSVFFASEAVLFGIVTEPPQGELRRRAVILLNAGADYHIGASGMYVALARRWARRGYVVLRMDLAGLGDSVASGGRSARK